MALLFFASGAAGLAYEVVWNRLLVLHIGNTAFSLATILTIVMAGLALGSWIGGRFASRIGDPLRAYGWLEVGAGFLCAALPWLFPLLDVPLGAAYGGLGPGPLFELVGFFASAAVLLFPATLLGATLPLMAEEGGRRTGLVSLPVGLLYGANTAGGFFGVTGAGFLLIPWLGLSATNLLAAATSVAAGLCALLLAGRRPSLAPAPSEPAPSASTGNGAAKVLLLAYAAGGFASMACQVAWTRIAVLSFGSASYAFSLVVGAFILGLALGAAAVGWLDERFRSTASREGGGLGLLVPVAFLLSLCMAATIPLLQDLPLRAAVVLGRYGGSFARLQAAEFAVYFLVILPPTFLMGGLLPLVTRSLAGVLGIRAGAATGRAYAANAAGTILGAFLGGFLLVPALGMRGTVAFAAACAGGAAVAYLFARGSIPRWTEIAGGTVAIAAGAWIVLATPRWDPRILTSGPWLLPPSLAEEADAETVRRLVTQRPQPLYHREDAVTTVTVARVAGELRLTVGGKPEATEGEVTQALLAHLPLLLHGEAASVLVVGLGAGGTLDAALRHPGIREVDVVEISPAVVEASALHFHRETRPLEDPRVRVLVGDGRRHLALGRSRYDLVLSQPGNPWMAGSSALFTREAFLAMRERLAPGGIAAVWVQGWMEPATVAILLETFRSAFPRMDLWETGQPGHLLLTGSNEPVPFDPERLAVGLEPSAVVRDLERYGIEGVRHLLARWITDGLGIRRLADGAARSTDDHDRVAARAGREVHGNHYLEVMERVHQVRAPLRLRLAPGLDRAASRTLLEEAERWRRRQGWLLEAMRLRRRAAEMREAGEIGTARALEGEANRLQRQALGGSGPPEDGQGQEEEGGGNG